MADKYIRIEDVVDIINVNADNLEQNGGIPYAQGARAMAIVVEQMPPADVVEVVRCGRCRYCTNNWHSSIYDLCKITGRNVIDTDFCNYGKRREE